MLLALAVDHVAALHGLTREAAAARLDQADVALVGDQRTVSVTIAGRPIVQMSRRELRDIAGIG
jgi:hypothetical protein